MTLSFENSTAHLSRAEQSIPLGSQTFSKSRTAFPVGGAPLYVTHGRGGRVFDVDGNEYVDLVCGLASVSLGYCDPDVDAAVRQQLELGVTFSLPHTLEAEVAEAIIEVVPCAERVRFGKNGSDATTAAIRLARAHTGRDHILMCGYHGWQDWSIGSTSRHDGVPDVVRELTTTFSYGDLEAVDAGLRRRPIAAVILEPMNTESPPAGFLAGLQRLCREHGALLIFDETVTGFRYALGGAQEVFGITPDLATFGKGLGNGLPIAVVCGRADVMRGMEEIFFSTTFGGETLSLAAASAVIRKMRSEPILESMAACGQSLIDGLNERIERHGAEHLLRTSGHPTWAFVQLSTPDGVSVWELRTLFMEQMIENGVLTLGTHNVCAAHGEDDVRRVLGAYDEVLPQLVDAARQRDVRERIRGAPLIPLFRPR